MPPINRYNEKLPAVTAESKSSLQLAKPPKKRRRKEPAQERHSEHSGGGSVASAYILYCQMQLTQLTAEVSKQSDNLSEMQAENVSLTTKKMNSMDMTRGRAARCEPISAWSRWTIRRSSMLS